MNAAPVNNHQLTHLIASEMHRIMSANGTDAEQVAAEMLESPAFIRRVLVGEDGLAKLIHAEFLQTFVNATGRTMYLKITPQRPVKRKKAVKSGSAS